MNENEMKMLIESDQRSKSNTHQINEIKDDIKEIKAENKAIYSLVESVKTISESVADMKSDIKEIKNGQTDLSSKIVEIENRPATKTAEVVDKIKVSVYTAIFTTVAIGILGSLIYYAK